MSLGREKRDSDVFNTSYRPGRNHGIGITTEGGWIHLNRPFSFLSAFSKVDNY